MWPTADASFQPDPGEPHQRQEMQCSRYLEHVDTRPIGWRTYTKGGGCCLGKPTPPEGRRFSVIETGETLGHHGGLGLTFDLGGHRLFQVEAAGDLGDLVEIDVETDP